MRGQWQVRWRFADRLAIEPAGAVPYHLAELHLVAPPADALSGRLVRVPGSRAPWEYIAPFEASDPPQWGRP